MELSIYSTCKRISQKLLRNVKKFLDLIYAELDIHPFKVIRSNCEELMIQGPESRQDVRMVNSYPSKVMRPPERERVEGEKKRASSSGGLLRDQHIQERLRVVRVQV